MTPQHWRAAERILVRLVVRSLAADYPTLLAPAIAESGTEQDSGPPAAAAAVAGAPPANAGGPEGMELEHDWSTQHREG